MNIISGIYWDKGERCLNQDSLMLEQVYTPKGRLLLAVVSDGIGGLAEGEMASGLIVEKCRHFSYREMVKNVGKGISTLEKICLRCLYEAGGDLQKYGHAKGCHLGATLSLLLIFRNRYVIMQLGDSRIYQLFYRYGRCNIQKMTTDQADKKGRLLKCLGSYAYQLPEVKKGRCRLGTGFLLCSDGFYRMQKEKSLQEVLAPRELTEDSQIIKRLGRLAKEAHRRGEKDNISAVYIICKRKGVRRK